MPKHYSLKNNIQPKLVGGFGTKWGDSQYHQQNRIYDANYIAMCIPSNLANTNNRGGGYYYLMDQLPIKNNTKQGYLLADNGDGIDISGRMQYHRGNVQKGLSQTLRTQTDIGTIQQGKIRRLTPKESFRLMGFEDADYEKASEVNKESSLYRQAGNSIVVQVLMHIFKEML